MIPQDSCMSSGEKTESTLIVTGPGFLNGIIIALDGTNNQTFTIYDNIEASGKKLIPTLVVTTNANIRYKRLVLSAPVIFDIGCYVAVSGAGSVGFTICYNIKR